jgi:hypothetical protein
MLAAAHTGALADGQDDPRLDEFYVVGVAETDTFPYLIMTILHVRPRESGSLVRYVLINGATPLCDRPDILAAEKLLEGIGIEQLQGRADVCSLDPDKVAGTVEAFARKPGAWDTARMAVVVKCDHKVRVFRLPTYKMDLTGLADAASDVYALTRIEDTAFEKAFPDARGGEWVQEYLSEDTGAALVNDIRSGRYDPGYWHCVEGDASRSACSSSGSG